jgi:hypothetical protein
MSETFLMVPYTTTFGTLGTTMIKTNLFWVVPLRLKILKLYLEQKPPTLAMTFEGEKSLITHFLQVQMFKNTHQ